MPMIVCEHLKKFYRKKLAVSDVNIHINDKEIVGILGPNGAGKTTTFYMIAGILRPDEGKVFLDNVDVTYMPMYKRAKMGLSYLPQEPSIFRGLNVEDNIMGVLEFLYKDKKVQKLVLEKLLLDFNIEHIRKTPAYAVSGGERRRVEVARALASEPKFMLLDEPFSGIDPIIVDELKKTILSLKRKGIGLILTDHNARELLSIVDRAYVLYDGKIVKEGKPDELIKDSKIIDIYLGKSFNL